MKITSSKYIVSSPSLQQSPYHDFPEFAFIGRSNVGKSSLINALTGNSKLAKTSSTPGKTRLINFFSINRDQFFIVDLPGYGYAKTSQKKRQKWADASGEYIIGRKQLKHLFILLDFRHKPQQIDLEFIQWAVDNDIPFSLIGTKVDKLNQKQKSAQTKLFRGFLEQTGVSDEMIITSSEKKVGLEDLRNKIGNLVTS